MKIAHLITTLGHGGAERQLVWLCQELRQRGHMVVVGCMKSGGQLASELWAVGVPVEEFGMRSWLDWPVYFRVRRWLQQHSPDLLHTHLFKADVFGGLAAGSLRTPFVSTKHNQDQYLKHPLLAWLARSVARRSRRIIAVAEAVRTFLAESVKFPAEQIEVIPCGIQKPVGPLVRQTENGICFGAVARLVPQKGHEFLLRAFAKARAGDPFLKLLLIGKGPLELELRNLAQDLQLGDSVEFCGLITGTEEIYKRIDILVLSSLWEGAPVVLLEAMIRGIPVIATSVGGVPELIAEGCGVLVPARDQEALTVALLDLAQDPRKRQRMSESGRNRAQQFTVECMVNSHLQLYERILRP